MREGTMNLKYRLKVMSVEIKVPKMFVNSSGELKIYATTFSKLKSINISEAIILYKSVYKTSEITTRLLRSKTNCYY